MAETEYGTNSGLTLTPDNQPFDLPGSKVLDSFSLPAGRQGLILHFDELGVLVDGSGALHSY